MTNRDDKRDPHRDSHSGYLISSNVIITNRHVLLATEEITTGIDVEALNKVQAGARLTRLTQFGMTAEAHRLMVWPAMMDMRVEYADARNGEYSVCATLILIRGYTSVLRSWLYGVIAETIKRMFSA
jgi:hypothetical protein